MVDSEQGASGQDTQCSSNMEPAVKVAFVEEKQESCPICLTSFVELTQSTDNQSNEPTNSKEGGDQKDSQIHILPCLHKLCLDCFTLLRSSNGPWAVKCPICRHTFEEPKRYRVTSRSVTVMDLIHGRYDSHSPVSLFNENIDNEDNILIDPNTPDTLDTYDNEEEALANQGMSVPILRFFHDDPQELNMVIRSLDEFQANNRLPDGSITNVAEVPPEDQ